MLPYAAQARYFEDALRPQPSGDADADVLFEAVTRDIFLGETRITPVAQSSSANEPDLKMVPRIPANDVLTTATLYKARDGLHCLRRFMLASYAQNPPQSICHLDLEANFSNQYVKLYSGVDADGKTRRVVVAFRGTVQASDWWNNIASQTSITHNNPLDNTSAINGGNVGSGWVTRRVNQATLQHVVNGVPVGSLASRLKEHANLAKGQGQKLVTYVTGHSLGAATADVASYDIAAWQKTQSQLAQEVVAASFNPPRFGRVGAREAYQDALKSTCGGPAKGKLCFAEPTPSALEALLLSEDDVNAGDLASAKVRVEGLFNAWPYESDGWLTEPPKGLNIGTPAAYYGLRMLEHILAAGPLETTGTLQMTAIVATCATVTRPTLPDLAPETVSLEIDPEILANDALVVRESTNLFQMGIRSGSDRIDPDPRWMGSGSRIPESPLISGTYGVPRNAHKMDDVNSRGVPQKA